MQYVTPDGMERSVSFHARVPELVDQASLVHVAGEVFEL